VEFGAHGLDVDVAWRAGHGSGQRATRSPRRTLPAGRHSSALRHPDASPFEVKTILAATADDLRNVKTPPGIGRAVSYLMRVRLGRALVLGGLVGRDGLPTG
jgi:hypothetical protein